MYKQIVGYILNIKDLEILFIEKINQAFITSIQKGANKKFIGINLECI
jgi:hypothetical protein